MNVYISMQWGFSHPKHLKVGKKFGKHWREYRQFFFLNGIVLDKYFWNSQNWDSALIKHWDLIIRSYNFPLFQHFPTRKTPI